MDSTVLNSLYSALPVSLLDSIVTLFSLTVTFSVLASDASFPLASSDAVARRGCKSTKLWEGEDVDATGGGGGTVFPTAIPVRILFVNIVKLRLAFLLSLESAAGTYTLGEFACSNEFCLFNISTGIEPYQKYYYYVI
jgi:hypothetical protein